MKQTFNILLIFFTLVSCQTNKADNTEIGISNEVKTKKNDDSIFIKDSSDYSIRFLNSMIELGMNNVSLVDSFLILSSRDTVTFPQIPEIGKKTILTAKKDEFAIALTIKRINQTTIDYKIEMVEIGNTSYNYKGQADLMPRFYLGSETDESSLTGISYLSTEFSNNHDSCYTYIRLGKEDSMPYLLGKIIKNCNGKIKNIGIDNFSTLVEK
ncbi:MAG: hypothetical protein N4A45_13240 [Flavobacteriales bacterium]|jgi:hypothetical protein|nr:hypothetical protein [Flavobacteriales bacterium]